MTLKKTLFYLSVLFCAATASLPLISGTPQEQVSEDKGKESAPAQPPAPPQIAPLEQHTLLEEPVVSYESAFIKMLVTLGGLILCVFLTIWILRRLGQGRFRGLGSSRSIQILEKRAISQKSVLYVVQVGHKHVLICESQLEVRCLTTLDEPPVEEIDK